MITADWIVWSILLFFALGWSFGWYWTVTNPGAPFP